LSQIATQNPTCDIPGDPDVYGPGFRYGFYLPSSAYLIIFAFKLDDEIRTILISSNIIAFAVYANTYVGAAERDFVIIEWWIVFWETIGLFLFTIPHSPDGLRKNQIAIMVRLLLWAMVLFTQPWLYFKALQNGRANGCTAYFYLFRRIDIFQPAWIMLGKVLAIVSCVVGTVVLLGLLYGAHRVWKEWHAATIVRVTGQEASSGFISLEDFRTTLAGVYHFHLNLHHSKNHRG
jgi:hypothetical protein